jgi:pilus assembly protein CpaB
MIAGKVTNAQIFPRTPLDTQMFGDQSQAPANVVPIDDGMVAVMVQMAEPARLAGLLKPGSQVTVYAPSEDGGGPTSPLINHSVTVLSPGGTVESATGGRVTTPSDTVTLELSEPDAAKVIGAASSGALYFVLRSGAGSGVQG